MLVNKKATVPTTQKFPTFLNFKNALTENKKWNKILFILTSFNLFSNIFVHLQHEFLNYPKTLFHE